MPLIWMLFFSIFAFFLGKHLQSFFGFDPPYSLFFGGLLFQLFSILNLFSCLVLFLSILIIPRFRSKLQK